LAESPFWGCRHAYYCRAIADYDHIDQSFGGIEAWVVSIADYRGTQWDVIRDTSGAYLAQCYEEGPITVENVTWI
jgi:hypothetical protein